MDKGFIGSKFYRVDFFLGASNDWKGEMSIHLGSTKTRKVLEASDLSGLLHGIEVGTS